MPLSSGSGASVGGSGAATILAPSARRFFSVSVSLAPKSAGGSDRNMRPNWPPKNFERRDSVSPRIVVPCALRVGPAMTASNFNEVVQYNYNILDCVDRRTDLRPTWRGSAQSEGKGDGGSIYPCGACPRRP